jgi:hypothetical protein
MDRRKASRRSGKFDSLGSAVQDVYSSLRLDTKLLMLDFNEHIPGC